MIRAFVQDDMEAVLSIWLDASVEAHHFIEAAYWQSKVQVMREVYLPASETFVFELEGRVIGFYSLYDDHLAALFVAPSMQGKGVGSALLKDAQKRRSVLQLTVYQENHPSVLFYQHQGFEIQQAQQDEHTGHAEWLMTYARDSFSASLSSL